MANSKQSGFAIIETTLILFVLCMLGFTGWFIWHAKQNADKSLNAATNSDLGIVVSSKVTDFGSCKAAKGSKMLETYPEQCVTKDGKKFTDVSQEVSSASSKKGTITGTLGYPSSGNPAQKVCAVSLADNPSITCVTTQAGQNTYTLELAEGNYNIYASLVTAQGDFSTSYKAYYDAFSKCGKNVNCPASGHTQYINVAVKAGQRVSDVDPQDWYNTN